MRWKIAFCITITIATVASHRNDRDRKDSVLITIEHDVHINGNDTREHRDETSSTTNGHTITITSRTTEEVVTDDVSITATTEGYSTATSITTTADPVVSVGTTASHEDIDAGSEESMTEVPESQESTSINSGDSNQSDRSQASRSVEVAERENIVQTTSGPVQGFEWSSISTIIAYIDVPYGKFVGYFQVRFMEI